jgi:hypothetical protein
MLLLTCWMNGSMLMEATMSEVRWERYPRVAQAGHARSWLAIQAHLGRAANTVDAYGRALEEYLAFSARGGVEPADAGREQIARYVQELRTRPNGRTREAGVGLANATVQQRLTAVRLFYDCATRSHGDDCSPGPTGRERTCCPISSTLRGSAGR